MIEVCCAIIVKGAKMLAVQRGPESSHPFEWEFPGGKVQHGETSEQCIVREISEELTAMVEVMERLEPVEFNYSTKQIRLIPFVCKIVSGDITLTEHLAKQWIGFDQWNALNWSGADRKLIEKNLESLRVTLSNGEK